jgi:hypothetical protein
MRSGTGGSGAEARERASIHRGQAGGRGVGEPPPPGPGRPARGVGPVAGDRGGAAPDRPQRATGVPFRGEAGAGQRRPHADEAVAVTAGGGGAPGTRKAHGPHLVPRALPAGRSSGGVFLGNSQRANGDAGGAVGVAEDGEAAAGSVRRVRHGRALAAGRRPFLWPGRARQKVAQAGHRRCTDRARVPRTPDRRQRPLEAPLQHSLSFSPSPQTCSSARLAALKPQAGIPCSLAC